LNQRKRNTSIFAALLTLSFLIYHPTAWSLGKKTPAELSADKSKVQLALEGFSSPDPKTATAAIITIASLEYTDMADLLTDMSIEEIKGPRKSRFLIERLLNEIAVLAHSRLLFDNDGNVKADSKLIELQVELQHLIDRDTRFNRTAKNLLGQVEIAIARAKVQKPKGFKLVQGDLTVASLRTPLPKSKDSISAQQTTPILRYKKFYTELAKDPKSRWAPGREVKAGDSGPTEILLAGTTRFVTDEIVDDINNEKLFRVIGRENILDRLLLVLSRHKQQNAVLLGSKGSGKTSIVDLLAEYIVTDSTAKNEVTAFLKDAVILQTSSARISRLAKSDKPAGQADAMEAYFQALTTVQIKTGRRIIVFIDELHTLTKEQVEAIKPFIESTKSQIMLIGASTSPEYRSAFKHNEAFLSRLQDEAVPELSDSEILYIFKESWMKVFRQRHNNIEISEAVMKLIIHKSLLVYPDKGILRASFQFADDLGTYLRFSKSRDGLETSNLEITSGDVFNFIQQKLGLPVDPTNFKGMQKYREKIKTDILKSVYGQDRMVDDVVDLWMSVLRNESSRGVRVGMLMGRSGTGKTETATQLAVNSLGSKERVLVIKASDYASADDIKLSILFGVPGGVRFGEHSSGILMDWLDDPSKGKYAGIIVIDEAEKASPLFWIRLMELFDTGTVTGGDNKTRSLNRHLILLTSNRGDSEIFPSEMSSWSDEKLFQRTHEYGEEELKSLFERILSADDKGQLPDTILNRIDSYSLSNVIPKSIARVIARRMLDTIVERYFERSHISIEVTDRVIDQFINTYDPLKRGARPLVRALDRYIRNAVEKTLGSIEYGYNDHLTLDINVDAQGDPTLMASLHGEQISNRLPNIGKSARSAMLTPTPVSTEAKATSTAATATVTTAAAGGLSCSSLFGR
jgi:ATP-dependent Clp protease ATP-binding subunit ClpC